jgi:hypothetical protein
MREPIASIVIDERHNEVLLGTTDRSAIAVDPSLAARRPISGLPVAGDGGDTCAVALPELSAFEAQGVPCREMRSGEPKSAVPLAGGAFDALAVLDLVDKDGSLSRVVAEREPGGKFIVRRTDGTGKSAEAQLDTVGAQLVIADLDLDGTPEIATTSELLDSDVLSIWSWQKAGLVERLHLPTKDSVRAVAACPPEEKGLPAVVAVVGGELWLVR